MKQAKGLRQRLCLGDWRGGEDFGVGNLGEMEKFFTIFERVFF